MTKDVSTDTSIENFAALELPFPSSFATRTLQMTKDEVNVSCKQKTEK